MGFEHSRGLLIVFHGLKLNIGMSKKLERGLEGIEGIVHQRWFIHKLKGEYLSRLNIGDN